MSSPRLEKGRSTKSGSIPTGNRGLSYPELRGIGDRMRIGITGANGFIGNHLIRDILGRGHRPLAFLQKGSPLGPLRELEGAFDSLPGDLLDADSLDAFLRRCDAVFHLAGLNRYWARDRDLFWRVNLQGVRNLIDGCLRRGVGKLVHVSSCITLGASEKPVPRNEESSYNLGDLRFPYGETKKAGEDEVQAAARKKGLPAVIVNPVSAIGEMDFGPTPIGKPILDIIDGRWPVYVAGGACFVDVRDVARGMWLALERGREGEKYLLAGENLTHREFMSRVAISAGRSAPRIRIPRPVIGAAAWTTEWVADRITRQEPVLTTGMSGLIGRYLYFDGSKAREELGFEAGPSLPAIRRSVDWFQSRRALSRGAVE